MYHFFVRRRLREVFRRLNAADFAFVRRQFHPRALHWFAGTHALSGQREGAADIARWYERLAVVFPGLHFQVEQLVVAGFPWHTVAVAEWRDEVRDLTGRPMPNQGTFVITLRWGRVTAFRVHCDTARLERNLAILSDQGVREAGLPAIVTAQVSHVTS